MGIRGAASGRPTFEAGAVALAAVVLGQSMLLALAPLSRESSDGVVRVGIALLSPDSDVYLDLASSSESLRATPWNRSLLILVLRAGTLLGSPALFLVLVQFLALTLATALTYRMASRYGDRLAGLAAVAVVAVNPLTAQWARFVLSETLMFSFVLAAVWAAERVLGGGQRHAGTLLLVPAMLATFLRPNGILLLGGALTLLALRRSGWVRGASIVMAWIGVAVGLTLGLLAAGQPAERPFAEQLFTGTVVEGADRARMTIAMPAPSDPEDASNAAALNYVIDEPLAVARLFATRVVVEVAQLRRHYPPVINLAIGLVMLGFVLAVFAGARAQEARQLRAAALLLGLPIVLFVGATFATPEGRYGWGGLIAAAPLAGVGAAKALRRVLPPRWSEPTPGTQSDAGPRTAR